MRTLLVCNVEQIYCEGGAHAVTGSLDLIRKINQVTPLFDQVIFVQTSTPHLMLNSSKSSCITDPSPFPYTVQSKIIGDLYICGLANVKAAIIEAVKLRYSTYCITDLILPNEDLTNFCQVLGVHLIETVGTAA